MPPATPLSRSGWRSPLADQLCSAKGRTARKHVSPYALRRRLRLSSLRGTIARAISASAPKSTRTQVHLNDWYLNSMVCCPAGTGTPTKDGASICVVTGLPSTVARQFGSKDALSITTPGRERFTRPPKTPSSGLPNCTVTTPGGVLCATPSNRVGSPEGLPA